MNPRREIMDNSRLNIVWKLNMTLPHSVLETQRVSHYVSYFISTIGLIQTLLEDPVVKDLWFLKC